MLIRQKLDINLAVWHVNVVTQGSGGHRPRICERPGGPGQPRRVRPGGPGQEGQAIRARPRTGLSGQERMHLREGGGALWGSAATCGALWHRVGLCGGL